MLYGCVCLSHPFCYFQQLCSAIAAAVCEFHLLMSSYFIHLIIYFGLYLFCSVYFLICLLTCLTACIWEHFILLFSSRHHMFPLVSFRHTSTLLFVCLCAVSVYTKCHLCRLWNDDDNSSRSNSSDWTNMFVQLLACFFVDATVQYIVFA